MLRLSAAQLHPHVAMAVTTHHKPQDCRGRACSRPAIGSCYALQGTIAEGAPVVPISAQLKYNIDAVCEYIVKKIPVPVR